EVREGAIGLSVSAAGLVHGHRTFVEMERDRAVLVVTGSEPSQCRELRSLLRTPNHDSASRGDQHAGGKRPPGSQHRSPRYWRVRWPEPRRQFGGKFGTRLQGLGGVEPASEAVAKIASCSHVVTAVRT